MAKRIKQSAGLLMFRETGDAVEVFLVHPNGPYWSKKNERSWTLPKGEYEEGEEALAAAQREFKRRPASPPAHHSLNLVRYVRRAAR